MWAGLFLPIASLCAGSSFVVASRRQQNRVQMLFFLGIKVCSFSNCIFSTNMYLCKFAGLAPYSHLIQKKKGGGWWEDLKNLNSLLFFFNCQHTDHTMSTAPYPTFFWFAQKNEENYVSGGGGGKCCLKTKKFMFFQDNRTSLPPSTQNSFCHQKRMLASKNTNFCLENC